MILKNMLLILPSSVLAVITRFYRTNLNEQTAKYISENGLYHFTKDMETANKILESGKINPSKGILNAYGKAGTYMFAGIPDYDVYLKNFSREYYNLLLHPERIMYAVKINARESDLSGYKMRVQDGAIIAEGGCILKPEQTEIKEIVIDYLPDKTGKKRLCLRERTKEEMQEVTDLALLGEVPVAIPNGKFHNYIPSNECLQAIKEERKRLGYVQLLDTVSTISHINEIENKMSVGTVKKIGSKLMSWFSNIKNGKIKALPQAQNEKTTNTLEMKEASRSNIKIKKIVELVNGISKGAISTTRPISSKVYSNTIVGLNKQGIYQKDLAQTFSELLGSSFYQYAKQKEKSIDMGKLYKSQGHGINHSRKVAILASEILQSSGINFDERMADILLTACYYHDIGRIADFGPHAKNSVRKLKKMELRFEDGEEYTEEDRNMLYAIVDAHEGRDSDIDKIMNKYHISKENQDKVKFYAGVLKDADALDRARLSNQFYMDLRPEYLRNREAKQLINFSFDLDNISRRMPTNELMELNYIVEPRENYLDSLKVSVSPTISRETLEKIQEERDTISTPKDIGEP